MTDNTQELNEILRDNLTQDEYQYTDKPHRMKQAILDWQNKQMLNELETLRSTATNPAHRDDLYYFDIGYSLVGRINKLKESK